MIMRMLNELRKRMKKHNKDFLQTENIKKNQTELKSTIIEIKNILEGINSRLDDQTNTLTNESK